MAEQARRPVVAVMGAGAEATPAAVQLAEQLGASLTQRGWAVLCGGRPSGVMAAVSRGARHVPGHLVIGVLPQAGDETAEVDVALFTGMGQARNVINVLSADVVVVCGGGGPGTASEAAHAIKAGKPLVLLAVPEVWSTFFRSLDPRVVVAGNAQECCGRIAAVLERSSRTPGRTDPVA
jgi:uncharacterized protein (TIGR00725 family)